MTGGESASLSETFRPFGGRKVPDNEALSPPVMLLQKICKFGEVFPVTRVMGHCFKWKVEEERILANAELLDAGKLDGSVKNSPKGCF